MKIRTLNLALIIGLSAAASAAKAGAIPNHDDCGINGNDQIVASFEREFAHQPGPQTAATGSGIDQDVLYKLINQELLKANDPVAESFARILQENDRHSVSQIRSEHSDIFYYDYRLPNGSD